MTTLYKYPIEIVGEQELQMPSPAEIRHVGLDPRGTPCVWAEVTPGAPLETLRLLVAGTGHPLPDECCHVGSFIQGPFVWHVFIK